MILDPLRLIRTLSSYFRSAEDKLITLRPDSDTIRGRVLLSYLIDGISNSYDGEKFSGHSNIWESREIARIFVSLGYIVDAIDCRNNSFAPQVKYDIVFDIYTNLQRLTPLLHKDALKILYCTGSDPYYQNRAEQERVDNLRKRRNCFYQPKRQVKNPDLSRRSIELADECCLLGNEHTLSTYPAELQKKMHLVTVSASRLGDSIKKQDELVPDEREFLWFFGTGAVHKGLDLLLEIFSQDPNLVLNIVGKVDTDTDFMNIYFRQMHQTENIKYHGYLKPDCERFKDIIKKVFCFIAPSCSESISSAVVTCMQAGIFPIISQDTGVTLPQGCGICLKDCSIENIRKAVYHVYRMSKTELCQQIHKVQQYALQNYSRERFRFTMGKFLASVSEKHRKKIYGP